MEQTDPAALVAGIRVEAATLIALGGCSGPVCGHAWEVSSWSLAFSPAVITPHPALAGDELVCRLTRAGGGCAQRTAG